MWPDVGYEIALAVDEISYGTAQHQRSIRARERNRMHIVLTVLAMGGAHLAVQVSRVLITF